jgi:hypothetical protein
MWFTLGKIDPGQGNGRNLRRVLIQARPDEVNFVDSG